MKFAFCSGHPTVTPVTYELLYLHFTVTPAVTLSASAKSCHMQHGRGEIPRAKASRSSSNRATFAHPRGQLPPARREKVVGVAGHQLVGGGPAPCSSAVERMRMRRCLAAAWGVEGRAWQRRLGGGFVGGRGGGPPLPFFVGQPRLLHLAREQGRRQCRRRGPNRAPPGSFTSEFEVAPRGTAEGAAAAPESSARRRPASQRPQIRADGEKREVAAIPEDRRRGGA
jgi:hypothetical protein